MNNEYLQELIQEAKNRGGGFMVSLSDKPEAVVLTIEKYNELVRQSVEDPATEAGVPAASPKPQTVLVTGGAGYIGAHVVRQLLKDGYHVVVIDNLSSGRREHVPQEATFVEGDLGDVNLLRDIFGAHAIDAVVHMAASIEVEESVRFPQKYYENNVANTAKLLGVMAEAGVKNIVFSSTAAVYGEQQEIPIKETARLRPNNPYGYSKLLAEKTIKYHCMYMGIRGVVFRYFNACGCDFDGQIKPTHNTHLIPIVMDVAKGSRPYILINGTDYQTVDGTCVRDYVHVLDIARAHVEALKTMGTGEAVRVYNIGTGSGSSVLEVVNKASEVLERMIPMETGPRRAGDAPATVADNAKIREELGFELRYSDLDTIIRTSWNQASQQ